MPKHASWSHPETIEKEKEYETFLETLKGVTSIKCNRENAMDGDLLYHVLHIYDREWVALKYYGKHKQFWHYRFEYAYGLWLSYKRGWIELRK